MRYSSAAFGLAQILTVFTLSTASLAAGSPAGQSPDGPAVEIESVTVATSPQAEGVSLMATTWQTPGGARLELGGDNQPAVILIPKGKDGYVLNTSTKQATRVRGTSDAIPQNFITAPLPRLSNERRLAPVDFLGYRCVVREGTLAVSGSLRHVQIWQAQINGKVVGLRLRSQGDDGSVQLVEAVSVRIYPQTPPNLLDVPAGYTVAPQSAATEQKGTPPALSARMR